ncbi:MAG: hypothetical protein IC227_05810 [Enterococcus lacertideformus]|uniref:Uncharacterized protein n=1 Tax=Enterococcus lacertideformus TaxID=2771493 RepID=A0A931AU97_9ENTE|nr:hypothetical protein [Enterococcus lacertideformus]
MEAAIQIIMVSYLSIGERQQFYLFLKEDPFLKEVLKEEPLSKIELKSYVGVALQASNLPF